MKFNLQAVPPPILVRVGGEEFKLHHRFLTAVERAAAIDSFSRGLSSATAEWWSYLLTWEGVTDEQGAPIAIAFIKPDGTEDRSNLDKVMGRVPFIEQVKTLLIQVAMNGVHIRKLHAVIADLVNDDAEADRLIGEIDPFFAKSASEPPGKELSA